MLAATASCQEKRNVKVTVTEENGAPVEGASVEIRYLGYGTRKEESKYETTNSSGQVDSSGTADLRICIYIQKEGYYQTSVEGLSRKQDHDVTYVLRKVRNPIPLYARRLQIVAPVKNENLGYDLEVGDWVVPHGEGKKKDLIFNVHHSKKDYWTLDYRLTVTFPNKHDGIQQFQQHQYSALKSPYHAPENGYLSEWIQTATRKGKDSKLVQNIDFRRGHWLRVRTKTDDQGNIISANYVKIYGDFPDIRYYFNPSPNDRNLEFDPRRGLFTNLKSWDRANDP